ncbi:MAG: hypothetical protein MI861_01450, partial [Pirellulales bacterium]|nr:hypothetical protein [Pirellulales bacterium]
ETSSLSCFPDLNVTLTQLTAASITSVGFGGTVLADQPVLGFMRADGNVEPCGASVTELNPGVWDQGPPATYGAAPNWLVGMALVQQSMDLSVARDLLGTATGLSRGRPGAAYSANTIERLRQPHRRFAHVMAPSSVTFAGPISSVTLSDGSTPQGCSMPILALSPPTKFLARGPTAPSTTATSVLINGGDTTPVGHLTMVGHLRPEFALGGIREGEDIVSSNALAFDVQVFDPGAPVFITVGPDGQPGVALVDDDGDGSADTLHSSTVPDLDELGALDSDDQVVTPNDPFFYTAVRSGSGVGAPISRGAFVDLGYVQQVGGNVRHHLAADSVLPAYYSLLTSPFSGATLTRSPIADTDMAIGLQRSGRIVIGSGPPSGVTNFVQYTFDSWTNAYEHDGLNQVRTSLAPDNNGFNGSDAQSTFWMFNEGSGVVPTPSNPAPTANGTDAPDPIKGAVIVDGSFQSDVAPPVNVPLRSLRVVFRNYDAGTRQIDQLELIEDFK